MSEFSGKLRHRVTVEEPVEERSATGVRVGQWAKLFDCLAAISPYGAGAEAEGQALSSMARFKVAMRWRGDVAVGQRVRWKDRTMIVRQVHDDPRFADRIELRCEEMRA